MHIYSKHTGKKISVIEKSPLKVHWEQSMLPCFWIQAQSYFKESVSMFHCKQQLKQTMALTQKKKGCWFYEMGVHYIYPPPKYSMQIIMKILWALDTLGRLPNVSTFSQFLPWHSNTKSFQFVRNSATDCHKLKIIPGTLGLAKAKLR